jgi:hypothetical protein
MLERTLLVVLAMLWLLAGCPRRDCRRGRRCNAWAIHDVW